MTRRISKQRMHERYLSQLENPAPVPQRQIKRLRRYFKRKDTHLYQSRKWHNLRKTVLDLMPICNVCKSRMSVQVDHIVPHNLNEDLFFNLKNLQGICKNCHEEKTAQERKLKAVTRKLR